MYKIYICVVWMCGPYWAVLRIYGSHDMRHTDFPRVDGGQRDTPVLGRHNKYMHLYRSVVTLSRGRPYVLIPTKRKA